MAAWLVLDLAITALQLYVVASTYEAMPLVAVAVVIGGQVLKMAPAAMRLLDLGRPQDDALLALVPLANLGLFLQLVEGTPSDELREKRLALWSKEITALDAFVKALGAWGRALPVLIVFAVPGGMLSAAGYAGADAFMAWVQKAPPDTQASAMQGLLAVSGITGFYAILQLVKRDRASRASWIPVLLTLPCLVLAGAISFGGAGKDAGPALIAFTYLGVQLLFYAFVATPFALAFVAIADASLRGDAYGAMLDSAIQALKTRLLDGIAVHGGAQTAIQLGLQVVIPGLYYVIAWAFTDMVVLFEPEKPAFARSSELSSGMRRRLFKAQMLGFVPFALPGMIYGMYTLGVGEWFSRQIADPTSGTTAEEIVLGTLSMLMVALVKATVLVVYKDRVAADASA
jgi:hypothetical protein